MKRKVEDGKVSLSEEVKRLKQDDSVSVKRIECPNGLFSDLVAHDDFSVTVGDDILNTFLQIPIKKTYTEKKWVIEYEKNYYLCEECSAKKMYDEGNEVYYCPACDSVINRIKDKVYNYTG